MSELKGVFDGLIDATFVLFLVFIYHSNTRIKIVVFPVSWFKPLCLLSHVLLFPTVYGLGAPIGSFWLWGTSL